MTTATATAPIDQNADTRRICEAIDALPMPVPTDARRAAHNGDFAGLAYIVNMAEGRHGNSRCKLSTVFDVADFIQGITPRTVFGKQ